MSKRLSLRVRRPLLLDLCCGQGGASAGYVSAGFDVVGVDIDPQPKYPYPFIQADALEFLSEHGWKFDAIHASFPCQAFTRAGRIRKNTHPDLITPGRPLLNEVGKPWVMENVPGSPLQAPIELCGCMFTDLGVYRVRWFETSHDLALPQLPHAPHTDSQVKMGRMPKPGQRMHVVGNFSGIPQARVAMGIDWMNREGLREAIPPVYTQYVGGHIRALLDLMEDPT